MIHLISPGSLPNPGSMHKLVKRASPDVCVWQGARREGYLGAEEVLGHQQRLPVLQLGVPLELQPPNQASAAGPASISGLLHPQHRLLQVTGWAFV